jgi:hypothetical protein
MSLQYKDLQPWVDMIIDALENRGSSSSGIPDINVYPYAQEYRDILKQIREKKIAKYHLDFFLRTNKEKIMSVTTQPQRVKNILDSIQVYFYKEFMK